MDLESHKLLIIVVFRKKKTVSNSVYYDYLHFIEPKLRQLAENLCLSKLNEAKLQEIM